MTNEYGSDPQPKEEYEHEAPASAEPAAHEGEAVHEEPFDDFGPNAHTGSEDTATVSQEAADHDETDAPPPRQSRSSMPVIAGVVGVFVLGLIVYWQFGHSASPPPVMSAQNQAPRKAPAASMPPPASGSSTDIDALYKPAPVDSTIPPSPPMPEALPIAPTTGMMADTPGTAKTTSEAGMPAPAPSGSAPPMPPVAATVPPHAPAAIPPSGTLVNAATATPSLQAPMPPSAPGAIVPPQHRLGPPPAGRTNGNSLTNAPNVPPAPANIGFSNDSNQQALQQQRIGMLNARIDDLQKSMNQQNKHLDEIANMIAAGAKPVVSNAVPPPAPGQASSTQALDSRLDRIEQDLGRLEAQRAARAAKAQSSAAPAVSVPAMDMAEANETAPVHKMTPTHHSHAHKKTVSHHKKPSPGSSHLASSHEGGLGGSYWVLRAATPKEAWVASDPTTAELRHVQIGDNLPGVGTIKSIRQSSGGWVIEGSAGSVH